MTEERRQIPSMSDEEMEGIADRLYERLKADLYLNAGKGFLGFLSKVFMMGIVAVAAWYTGKHGL